MVFSSIPFLYYYLPIVLIVYFLSPNRFKNTVLLLASLCFYAWGEPKFVIAMILTILQGYIFGLLIEKSEKRQSKIYMTISVVISLGMLAYFKYAGFFVETFSELTGMSLPALKIALPIGISFYTFQILSYIIDVYRRELPAQKSFVNLAAYIAMFPQLIAGPIVRYSTISEQLTYREHSISKCALGIRRFTIGLGKKVLIANTLGELCTMFKDMDDKSVLFFWMYAIAFALHIYFDFSGYSDMAIGLGKILGFDFLENFNYPYIAKNVTEFWRRWHISLGAWFRDYVYIPLGGSKVKESRWLFNIFVVWFATGLWHGAAWNFAIWGLFYGVILVIEKLWLLKYLEKSKIIGHVYTIFAVVLSMVIFDAVSMSEGWLYITSMFGFGGVPLTTAEAFYYLGSYGILFAVAIIGATPAMKNLVKKITDNKSGEKVINILEPIFIVVILGISTAFIVSGSFNPFLYFRF